MLKFINYWHLPVSIGGSSEVSAPSLLPPQPCKNNSTKILRWNKDATEALILQHPDPIRPLIVEVDASVTGEVAFLPYYFNSLLLKETQTDTMTTIL